MQRSLQASPYPRPRQHEFVQPTLFLHFEQPLGIIFNLIFSLGIGPLQCLFGADTSWTELGLFKAILAAGSSYQVFFEPDAALVLSCCYPLSALQLLPFYLFCFGLEPEELLPAVHSLR